MNINNGVASTPSPPAPTRLKILLSIPDAERAAFITPETRNALNELGDVTEIAPAGLQSLAAFAAAAVDMDAFITAWGFPRLDAEHVASAPNLKCVVHAASSLHALVSDAFWATGIPISQAGAAMAPAVAELSLTFTLNLLRRVHQLDHSLRTGANWEDARNVSRAREISGARIGVVGASRTGRRYIDACLALGATVSVYDPYIPQSDPLATRSASLHDVMANSDVVAVHAPATNETEGLVGAAELALLPDGAAFVNTARSTIVDMEALYKEVHSGRIDAALDVFDQEPLPADSPWRSLPNVLLTPHLGGATIDSRRRAGGIVVDELRRFISGQPMEHALTRTDLERMG
ncbi:D-3-phosphoglycerate dehydrogenase [Arthrobacter sp. MYb23]|uniref:hydroxyacid dehydrogenase n=1 Tax=unclassified Arthrobacter TaxID=235627 RepID=UPI000CFBB180|nr:MULTISPECIES: hydroxyacid dehydrogenase [unclassified Arthrobacter]PRB41196.1 D-3-phosphoglycerate dehydrogenase [Arthrobacter sp. MYb51]PRB95488.1 D-3-phosphoglycerate dehydrogenase [Arthrobacter sp. MYb23]